MFPLPCSFRNPCNKNCFRKFGVNDSPDVFHLFKENLYQLYQQISWESQATVPPPMPRFPKEGNSRPDEGIIKGTIIWGVDTLDSQEDSVDSCTSW